MKETLSALKAARFFSPFKLSEMNPSAAALDSLEAFPFLSSETISSLKEELPHYIAVTKDIDPSCDPLVF